MAVCEECDGAGKLDCGKCGGSGDCPHCGEGTCQECNGDGTMQCEECEGTGEKDERIQK